MEYPKFKVCCRCFTFNQAKYITDTMDGFTMQQTSFPFVCTIVDDASTDGEQEVIKQYVEENFDLSESSVSYKKETDFAHIIYAKHKINNNCYFAVLFLKENHYSIKKTKMQYLQEWRDICEYEAMCEGDDYWIDEKKLQKQVNILDNKPEVSMVFTGFDTVNITGQQIFRPRYEYLQKISHSGDLLIEYFYHGNFTMTCTVCLRIAIVRSVLFQDAPSQLDYMIFLAAAVYGKCWYLPEKTSAYRKTPGGAMDTIGTKMHRVYDDISYYVLSSYFNSNNIIKRQNIIYNTFLFIFYIRAIRRKKMIMKTILKDWRIPILLPIEIMYSLISKFKQILIPKFSK